MFLMAFALLSLGDWVPRSRSFDVAVRVRERLIPNLTATSKLRDSGTPIWKR